MTNGKNSKHTWRAINLRTTNQPQAKAGNVSGIFPDDLNIHFCSVASTVIKTSNSSNDKLTELKRHSRKPRSGELRTQKSKSHLVRTQSLNVLPLKSGVGQYIAIHATLTARNFFLAYFHPSGPFTCIFSKTSPNFFLCWLWLTPDPV